MHDTQDEPIVRSTEAAGKSPERPDEPVVAPPTASEAEPTIEAEPGPQAEQAAEPAAELAPEPASDVELTAEPEPPAAPELEPSAEPEAPVEPEAQPVPEPEHTAEPPAEPEPEHTAEPPAEPEPEHTAEPPAEPEPAAELAAGSEAESAQVVATPTVRRTVSQAIAQQLHAAGARYCFTVPAEPILPLLDDLAETGIRVVTTRHEGSAAFMAEALAQLTGRPHIVAVSRAVGAANAAVGIHTALQDSAPLVALAGQVETGSLGREAFQEADLVASVGSLASWAAQIDEPDAAPSILAKARRRLETGRPGPLLLSVPRDVQQAEIEVADGSTAPLSGSRGPAADRSAVSRAMKMLAGSERGVIVAGAGVLRARAGKRLVALSEAMAIPVIAAWRRPDVFPNDHVNFLGMAGSGAAATVGPRLADADVILFIGTRLSEISTAGYRIPAPDTRWIHVDVQPRVAHAGLAAPTLSISADAARFLDSAWSDLRAAALDNEMRSRREARNAADREAYKAASATGLEAWHGPGAHPGLVVRVLRAVLPDNAVITTDSGNLAAFVARAYRFRRAGTFIGATSGSMGYGLPAAIAASLHEPDRIAVAVCGDGGFAMTAPELETAVREGAHPIVVVLDNQRYGMIADQQLRLGRSTRQSELGPIDFAAVARAHGALGFSVADDAGFEAALREAIGSRQASVIHVSVDPAWRSVDDNPVTPAS